MLMKIKVDLELFKLAVLECRDGITIADMRQPDAPLTFVNPGFEKLTGYAAEEILGKNCRFLQAGDKDQEAVHIVSAAIGNKEPCLVTLRNYRKDGSTFFNEVSLSPILSAEGELTHYIGIQKNVTDRIRLERQMLEKNALLTQANEELRKLSITDDLTGLYNRRYFDMQLDIQIRIARRMRHTITLFLIDVDHFKTYNDLYGHQAGDETLINVAKVLNRSFQRAGDFAARYGGEEFAIITTQMTREQATTYANSLCQRVCELKIVHKSPRVSTQQVTISIGHVTCMADSCNPSAIISQADKALYQAKREGRNRAICG